MKRKGSDTTSHPYRRKKPALARTMSRTMIYKAPRVEKKNFDLAISNIASAPYLNPMAIAQGVTGTERIGRAVNVQSIRVRIYLPGITATVGQAFRLMIILDRQANSALANYGNTLQLSSNTLTPINANQLHRYKVLCDEMITAQNQDPIIFDVYRKCNFQSSFAGTGTISEGNQLLVSCWNVNSASASGFPSVGTYYSRVRFTDA